MTAYGEVKITFINFRKYYTYNISISFYPRYTENGGII